MLTQAEYDAQDQGPALLAVVWTLTGIATIMVSIRLFIRTRMIRNLGLDDWLIAFSMVLGIVNVALTTLAVHHGFGKHSSTIGLAATEKANFIIDIGWIFGILSFAVPKLGIAALLNRILNPTPRVWWCVWGLTGFVGTVAVVNILVFFTSCRPRNALWHVTEGATCRSTDVLIGYATFNGATSAFTDLALAIYPSMVLWRLQMSLRKKIALCMALGVGSVSACAAIIKTTHLKSLADVTDATYGSWALVMWTNAFMAATKTVQVPHLGGIKAGYALSNDTYDPSKPTCVLINSMCMTASLYQSQFEDSKLTDAMNLLAIEPLGHGATSCPSEHFTYWDTAIMALQVMDQLGVQKAFALGTSQGGWMVARMALLAPERILGIMPLGSSMDYESADSRSKGCWDPAPLLTPFYQMWTSASPTPDFVVDETWRGMVASFGFGAHATADSTAFWSNALRDVYQGDEGRKKARMAVICLLERDGLLLRLGDIQCPVYWLHGTEDSVYSTKVAEEQIQLFTRSRETKLVPIAGGAHYLNATNPGEVNEALLELVNKHK
ncbi:Alpha/Beta hydrolase protein [Aspergillus ambiguus]|uniref:alpha/beta fold hydrolase n=1 Tax=Aspergillus ambiguus TaxID=176160 RepID=UPI003CCDE955